MDELMMRYLDGELTAEEARSFLARLAEQPALERELRALEGAVDALTLGASDRTSAGFTDRVMDRIASVESAVGRRPLAETAIPQGHVAPRGPSRGAPRSGASPAIRRPVGWALAATLLLAVGAGYLAALFTLPGVPGGPGDPDDKNGARQLAAEETDNAETLRIVRLVYVPRGEGVHTVTVAGAFNDWSTTALPLAETDGVWTAILTLPPGTYEYMFVENGERWVTDPLALRTRDDGFGGDNAILDVTG